MFFLENGDKKKILNDFKKKLDECLNYSNGGFMTFYIVGEPYKGFEKHINDLFGLIEASYNGVMVDHDYKPTINKELVINTIYFIYKNHLSKVFNDYDESSFFDVITDMFDNHIHKIYWKDRYKGLIPLNTVRSFFNDVLNLVKKKFLNKNISFRYLIFI